MAETFEEKNNNSSVVHFPVIKVKSDSQNSNLRSSGKDQMKSSLAIMNISKQIRQNNIENLVGQSKTYYNNGLSDSQTEPKSEEYKEISQNLTLLRKRYDEIKEIATKKEKEIQSMRNEIEKLKLSETKSSYESQSIQQKYQQLEESLEFSKNKTAEAELNKKTYEHMLDRMKKDILIYQSKTYQAKTKLQTNLIILNGETEKSRKNNQTFLQSQNVLDEVMRSIEKQHKKREKELDQYKKYVQSKQESEKKREERVKKQQELADFAANDSRDLNERKWRELLYVHKFLSLFLKSKMEREMSKYSEVEQAFQLIRASTGINDASQLVTKYMRRERTYSQLLASIGEYESKLEETQKENEKLREQQQELIDELQLQEKPLNNKQTRLSQLENSKETIILNEKAKKSMIIYEKFTQWTNKMVKKLNKSHEDQALENHSKETLLEAFNQIKDNLTYTLNSFKQIDLVNYVDLIEKSKFSEQVIDEQFIKKNIRVKPLFKKRENENNTQNSFSEHSIEEDQENESNIINDNEYLESLRKAIKERELGLGAQDSIKKKKVQDKKGEENKKN